MTFLLNLIFRLIRHPVSCHEFAWAHNYHGDMINHMDGKRSRWDCKKCYASMLHDELGPL